MFVIQVDAGFLLAGAAQRINGSPTRERVIVNHEVLTAGIIAKCNEHTSSEFLRLYWYDASHGGVVDADQAKVADLPGTKLRLGRLVRGEQKGVDSRIIADMMRLAWRKAVNHIFLVSGDEDTVEAVEEAAAQGVRVTLVGIDKIAQSRMLIQAADELLTLDDELIKSAVAPIEPTGITAISAGETFARAWLTSADPSIVASLLVQADRKVPTDIDSQLIKSADTELGGILRGQPQLRDAVRAGFWSIVEATR